MGHDHGVVHSIRNLTGRAAEYEPDIIVIDHATNDLSPVVAMATFLVQYRRGQSPEDQASAAGTSFDYMPYMTVSTLRDGFEACNGAIRDLAMAVLPWRIAWQAHDLIQRKFAV